MLLIFSKKIRIVCSLDATVRENSIGHDWQNGIDHKNQQKSLRFGDSPITLIGVKGQIDMSICCNGT